MTEAAARLVNRIRRSLRAIEEGLGEEREHLSSVRRDLNKLEAELGGRAP